MRPSKSRETRPARPSNAARTADGKHVVSVESIAFALAWARWRGRIHSSQSSGRRRGTSRGQRAVLLPALVAFRIAGMMCLFWCCAAGTARESCGAGSRAGASSRGSVRSMRRTGRRRRSWRLRCTARRRAARRHAADRGGIPARLPPSRQRRDGVMGRGRAGGMGRVSRRGDGGSGRSWPGCTPADRRCRR